MRGTESSAQRSISRDVVIEKAGAWQVAVLAYSPPFASHLEADELVQFATGLQTVLERAQGVDVCSFLQLWTVIPKQGSEQVERHRRGWHMRMGLGVWPHRKPPGGWTDEGIQDAAAAVFRGDVPELPSYRLLHLTLRAGASAESVLGLRATGNLLQVFSTGGEEELFRSMQAALQPRVAGTDFAAEEFYVPLLDRVSAMAAAASGELDQLLGSAAVYVRDSAEDRGLLLVSRLPLRELLGEVERSWPATS